MSFLITHFNQFGLLSLREQEEICIECLMVFRVHKSKVTRQSVVAQQLLVLVCRAVPAVVR